MTILRYLVKPFHCKQIETEDGQYRVAYGIVIDPEAIDSNTGERIRIQDLRCTAHYFTSHYEEIETPKGSQIVESYIMPVENIRIADNLTMGSAGFEPATSAV